MGSKVTKSPGKNNSKIRLVSWLHFLMCLSFNAPFTTWFFLKPYLTILYLPNCLIGLIYILLGGFRKIVWNPKIVWLKTSLVYGVFYILSSRKFYSIVVNTVYLQHTYKGIFLLTEEPSYIWSSSSPVHSTWPLDQNSPRYYYYYHYQY